MDQTSHHFLSFHCRQVEGSKVKEARSVQMVISPTLFCEKVGQVQSIPNY